MNRDELLQILQEETDGFTEQSRLRDDVLDALEKVQKLAINYTRCCTELVCDKCGKKDIDSIDVNLYKCIWCKNEFTN